jgi:hypothetical protein
MVKLRAFTDAPPGREERFTARVLTPTNDELSPHEKLAVVSWMPKVICDL